MDEERMARTISIQAAGVTGTGVGKSLAVALLCRIFSEDGYKVAPFKALNLTNVTYRDEEGREFGYSQALQAVAAGIEPDYRMNPFTPKPLGNGEFELILEGRVVERYKISPLRLLKMGIRGIAGAEDFYNQVMESVRRCLQYLMDRYDIVCIEGSGPSKLRGIGVLSKFLDIPNMETARLASAPVILLANNIDSAIATYHYLPDEEKNMIKGVILNRFMQRDLEREITEDMGIPRRILDYGIRRAEKGWIKILSRGMPVEIIGYIPYLEELSKIPDLDPLFSDRKVDMDLWRQIVPKIAKKVRKKVDIGRIYRLMGL
ncbi:MAG: hypothetical protein ACP5LQ_08675 [Candidatus Methanodesulfokora sp.]